MSTSYDGIILGAGHNGLILQAYMGQAGLRTLCIERRSVIGGGLATEEWPGGSGFFHNTHSFFHRALDRLPWYLDLKLAERGAVYIEPRLNVAMILKDGRTLQWWADFDKTLESFAAFSVRDADTLQSWRERFQPIVQNILVPESRRPPVPSYERRRLLAESPDGQLLLETSRPSPLEFVRREFEHPVIQAGLLFFNGLREVDLRLPGFGHHIPSLLASDGMAQMCIGGSHRLALALEQAVLKTGGEILLETELERIVVENGKVIGVETTAGDLIRATKFVASSLNPQQTFLDLIDPSCLPNQWIKKARHFQYNLLAPLFSLNINLDVPPEYSAPPSAHDMDQAFMVILGLEHVDQFQGIIEHHERGTIPPTVMWGACPTRFDPTQAPAGRHTAFMWEKLPFALDGNCENWDRFKDSHGQAILQMWSQYAPNVARATNSFTRSPLDTQRMLRNMQDGDLLVGAFANGQVGYDRPFPGAGHYRGHLDGLYLCGSCCHPGGNITGLPAYNAAQVILADLGIEHHR